MKIRCPQCYFENLKKSIFCQECGYHFNNEKKNKDNRLNFFYEEIEKIDDAIFQPKKKKISFKNIIIGIFILGFLGFVSFLILILSYSNDNNKTSSFPINYLNITDYEIIYDNYGEAYFVGTLKNTYSKTAKNVKVKLDFYHDKSLMQLIDTRKVIIEEGVEANGTFSFEEPLYFYPQDKFWWIWQIEDANYDF